MNLNNILTELHAEVEPLLAMVDKFSRDEIAARIRSPETPLTEQDLVAIVNAAQHAGLLDATREGYGLWSEYAGDKAFAFTLPALRMIAGQSATMAFCLHTLALGEALKVRYPCLAHETLLPLMLEGSLGLGRSALGRWLQGQADGAGQARDLALLADCYGDRQRLLLTHQHGMDALVPMFDQGNLYFARVSVSAAPAPGFHGLDGLQARTGRVEQHGPVTPAVEPAVFGHFLMMQTLGFLAIATGAAEQAGTLANEYTSLRKQGGRLIVRHDAVAGLMAVMVRAIDQADLVLRQGAMQLPENLSLAHCLAQKITVMSGLSEAVNAAMQILGGVGYMRDYGIEQRLRDINCLRVLGGSQSELPLLVSSLQNAAAAQVEAVSSRGGLPGHVNGRHRLSPLTAFKKLPLLKLLSDYRPRDLWQEETASLPRPLAVYRRQVRQFAEQTLLPRSLELDRYVVETGRYPPQRNHILRKAGKAGLLSDLLPAPIGSIPLSRMRCPLVWQQAIRVEELARADGGLMLLLSAHNLGLAPVLYSGNLNVLREVVIPAFRENKKGNPQLFAYAITEPAAGSDAEDGHGAQHNRPGVVATRANGGWLLQGRKLFISGGDTARWITVFAAIKQQGFDSWTAFLVDTQAPGFAVVRTENKMGMRVSGAAELELNQYFVPDQRVLGGVAKGWGLNRATLNLSRLPVAAMSVGFAQQACESAVEFACRMSLGNRPLIHYQQVQLQLADMLAETSAIRALVWQFSRGWTPRQSQASMAKFYASDRAQTVIESAMDLMGNHSLLHESRVEKNFRDNRLTRIFEGTNQINRLAVIEEQQQEFIRKMAANGWS